jgi:hypothetical protein
MGKKPDATEGCNVVGKLEVGGFRISNDPFHYAVKIVFIFLT